MRVSDRHQFVFIANPRCGSTSVRFILNPYSNIKSKKPPPAPWLRNHASAPEVYKGMVETGSNPEQYTFFTTIRNPWARVLSSYNFGLKTPASAWHAPAVESGSFDIFVQNSRVITRWRAYTLDNMSAGIIQHIVKMEELNTELPKLLMKLIGHHIEVPHLNSTSATDYKKYYRATKSIEIVQDIFSSDICYAGYQY